MKEQKRRLNNEGFSLIELIVVIAIMAILVGAMAPRVTKYIESARRASDVQALGTVFTAVQTTSIEAETTDSIATPKDGTYVLGGSPQLGDAASFETAVKSLITGGNWPTMTSKALKNQSISVKIDGGAISVYVTAVSGVDVPGVTVSESGTTWTVPTAAGGAGGAGTN